MKFKIKKKEIFDAMQRIIDEHPEKKDSDITDEDIMDAIMWMCSDKEDYERAAKFKFYREKLDIADVTTRSGNIYIEIPEPV